MIPSNTSIDGVCSHFNVSRETSEKIEVYQQALIKWNSSINLVSRSTINESAVRHFADSIQMWELRETAQDWVDIGSGAGFPGMVLAIMAGELDQSINFHLVESDTRKCAFLRNVSRETGVPVTIHNERIENVIELKADVVSARALASLTKLFEYSENILRADGICLYLKGQNCDNEIAEASRNWVFETEKFNSQTDQNGTILRARGIARVK